MERPLKSRRNSNGQYEVYDKNTDLIMTIDAIMVDEEGVNSLIKSYNQYNKILKENKKLQKEANRAYLNGNLEFGVEA
jgi:hypothetical protein